MNHFYLPIRRSREEDDRDSGNRHVMVLPSLLHYSPDGIFAPRSTEAAGITVSIASA